MGNTCCSSSSAASSGNENAIALPDLNLIEDISHLDELINYIHQRLNAIEKAKESAFASRKEAARSVRANLCIQFGSRLLENVRKRVYTRCCKICFKYILSRETRKVLIDVLKESAKVHWLAIGLSVVAYVLDQIDQISDNKTECLQLLRYMFCLAKHIKQLDEQLPQAKKKFNDVVQFIVKGCTMCLSQMTSSNLFSFFSASINAEDLKSFELELAHTHSDLALASIIALLEDRPTYLPPSQGQYPDAVGIDKARDGVTELLNMKDLSPRAVVVCGVGGIGKTTLATAVFNRLNLTGYKHCRVNVLQNCSDNDIKLLQEQILRDLFSRSNLKLRDCVEGQDELSNSFGKEITHPIFMFIDNALKGTDLVKLLPRDLSCLPAKSRLLITTRKFDETALPLHPHIQRHAHHVDRLPSSEARKLLCKKALGSAHENFENDVDVDGLVEICCGIPLVLEMVGCNLKKDGSNVPDWHNYLKEILAEGEGDFSEKVVNYVYNALPDSSYKEAFLDIASFSFFGEDWKRRWVAYIVGEVELKSLEKTGLVKTSDHGRLEIRGKWLSKSDRITGKQDLKDILQDKQRIQQIKGIFFNKCIRDFAAERATQVELAAVVAAAGVALAGLAVAGAAGVSMAAAAGVSMAAAMATTVEAAAVVAVAAAIVAAAAMPVAAAKAAVAPEAVMVVMVAEEAKKAVAAVVAAAGVAAATAVVAAATAAFFRAASLDIDADDMDLMNKSLRIFGLSNSLKVKGRSNKKFKNLRCIFSNQNPPFDLKNLQRLAVLVSGASHVCELPRSLRFLCVRSLDLHESIGNLSSLEEIIFYDAYTKCSSLPNSFGQLKSLHRLTFRRCKNLIELPESFGSLGALEKLKLDDVPKLKRLPHSFGQLNSLRFLKLQDCLGLTALPESFGNLSSLESLHLNGCDSLQSLPHSFSQLNNLKVLQMSKCTELSSLPVKFGELKALKYLNMQGCEGLKRLCNDFRCLKSLVAMTAEGCSKMEGKAMDSVVEVKSMMFLNIRKSPMLIERWAQIKETHPLLLFSLPDEADTTFDGPGEFLQKMFSSLMSGERKCMHVDGGGNLVQWIPSTSFLNSPEKVSLFFTLPNLFSASNGEALQIVRERILELTAQNFYVIYIAGLLEGSEKLLRQLLLSLPEGVLAWMPPDIKTSQLFAYFGYNLAVRKHMDFIRDAFHSFFVSVTVGMEREGKPEIQFPNLSVCVDTNGNYFDDFGGSFQRLFSAFERVEKVTRGQDDLSSKGLIKLFEDVEGSKFTLQHL